MSSLKRGLLHATTTNIEKLEWVNSQEVDEIKLLKQQVEQIQLAMSELYLLSAEGQLREQTALSKEMADDVREYTQA